MESYSNMLSCSCKFVLNTNFCGFGHYEILRCGVYVSYILLTRLLERKQMNFVGKGRVSLNVS